MDTGHEDGRKQGKTFVKSFPLVWRREYRFDSVSGNFQLSLGTFHQEERLHLIDDRNSILMT